MTANVNLSPLPKQRFTDSNGNPLSGGKLFTYAAGTVTKQNSYTDSTGATPNTNPVILDTRGEAPVWLDQTLTYKIVLAPANDTDPPLAPIWTIDNIPAAALGLLAGNSGSSLVGFLQAGAGAIARTVQAKLRDLPVSVSDFGAGTELGALINLAITAGYTNIFVPALTNWTWTTVVTLPSGWRGRIFGESGYGVQGTQISASTGHNIPCIDAQGALFVEIDGLHVLASDGGNAAPACFMVMARMLSGSSSGNHKIRRCTIEGPFYYCGIYNVGAEELVLEDNYIAMYSTAQAVSPKIACVVHQLSEDAFYSGIVTKQARTNGVSTSAIQHRGNAIKNQNASGCSMIYIGPNVNDIDFDDVYGTSPASSYCFYAAGYCDGIRIGVSRIETDKTTPIFAAPNDVTMGLVSLYKGAYRRSGAQDATHYAVDIGGTTASGCAIHVAPIVSFTGTFAGGTEDIYLVRATRKATVDISFRGGGPEETLINSKVNISTLIDSSISMGLSANLTVATFVYGNRLEFYYDPSTSKQAHDFRGGMKVSGRPLSVAGVVGNYQAMDSTLDTTANGIHCYFINPNGVVGSISSSGSATAYATSSDYRLKTDAEPLDGATALAAVRSWPIKSFKWKVDGTADIGAIAHELQAVKPSAVRGEKDAMREVDGVEVIDPQGVDWSKCVPELIAAVQYLAQKAGL